jgi:putative ABC transport system permease protein
VNGLGHDVRHAVRVALRQPCFSALVVGALALGIGLNGAVFGLVDALLLRPPPVAEPERLAHVYSSVPGDLLSHAPMAFPDYEALRDAAASFAGLAAYAWYPLALERDAGSELVMAELVTGNYFELLGVAPALGRAIGEADDGAGAPGPVAVLSRDAWQRIFGAAPDAVGRELRLNGRIFTVVGIAPAAFRGLVPGLAPDLWLPIQAGATLPTGVTINFGSGSPGLARTADRGGRWVWVVGRLREDASLPRADAEVRAVASRLGREFPETNARRAFSAVAAGDVRVLPGVDRVVWAGSLLAMGVFGLGLLLASANVASLFLARALGRRREIATRLALGAGRGRLVRQLFFEGLLLALAGGGLGLSLAWAASAWLGRVELQLGWRLQLPLAAPLEPRLLGFTLAAAVLSSVVFALLPALDATRRDLAGMLRELGAGASPGAARRLRSALVAVQVAIAIVLLDASGVALRGLLRTARIDPGFDPGQAAALTLSPDLLGYPAARCEEFFARVRERVSRLPGVRSAAFASHLPLGFAINVGQVTAEADAPPHDGGPLVDSAAVGPGYFEAMRIPLALGRPFAERDGPDAPRVAIVNETLARRLWPSGPALGRRVRAGDGAPLEVVGVARDGKYRTLGEPARPFLYTSLDQDRRGTRTLVVRSAGDPRPLLPALRDVVRDVDARVPLGGPRTLADSVADALRVPRLAAGVFGFFGAAGLLLAAAGAFGVVAYLASARTREIGLRLALGASPGAILRWLLRRGLAPVAAGLGVGTIAVLGATRALASVVSGLWPIDVRALLAAAALLALAALAAALAPARFAAGVDPAAALRRE